jgi:hypothetical protein
MRDYLWTAIGERRRQRLVEPRRQPDPIKVRLTTGSDYAHQGHRLDLADERLISHREPRWIDGRRYVWDSDNAMWCLSPDLHRTAEPPRKQPPREIRLAKASVKHETGDRLGPIMRRAVDRVVDAGGRPEEVVLVVGRRLR